MGKISSGLIAGLMTGMLAAGEAGALQSKCLSKKTLCASKKAFSLIKCEWRAETPGRPKDPNAGGCLDRANDRFDGGGAPETGCFEKVENKADQDCLTTDDTAALGALIDDCVASIVDIIDPMLITQTRCGVRKKKCAAKKLKKLLRCYSKSQVPGNPTDPNAAGCVDRATAKFDGPDPESGCVSRIESSPRNDCRVPMGNQAEIGDAVDACVRTFITALDTAPPTTTTLVGTTSTSSSTVVTTSTTSSSVVGTTTTSTPGGSTTSTTSPAGASCSANGLRVIVSLEYNEQLTGSVTGTHFRVNYAPPLDIPGTGNATTVRQRVTKLDATSLIPGSSISDNDTNGDLVDDAFELNALDSSGSLGPGPIFRLRYSCPDGQAIPGSSVSCVISQITDAGGLPHPQPELVSCTLELSPEP